MLSPQALFKGLVARVLPQIQPDSQGADVAVRLGRYGDMKVETSYYGDTLLADEGALMSASMLQGATSLQLGLSATYSSTAAAFVLTNTDVTGGKRIYPRALTMSVATAPTSGTNLRYSIVLDNVNRMPTTLSSAVGGTGPGTPGSATAYRAPVFCTNMDLNPSIIGVPFFPLSTSNGSPPTVPAAGPAARTIVGNKLLKGSIPVVLDQYTLQFGGGDFGGTFQGAAALAKIVEHAPAIAIGPGQSMLIYLWSQSNATAGIAFDDVNLTWIEK